MRVDKFLWCVRYFKTRTIATTAIKKGHVKVNGDPVKPSRDVYATDKIQVRKDQINYTLTINDLPPNRVGAKLVDLYRTDTTPKEAFAANELLKYSKDYYRKKGTGRPTKKDRRDIDDYKDENEPDNQKNL
ncbi:RNA-binding S4 domain-containing protein [Bizionia argentinensis JUB59]|uniref:RNA-binding S4 domain-containing protein n=1 Tax=Bizionia argentinensis JUB59 TaxID=1046627 RepID=G2EGI3_9FLAO|nr:RNA-binding S4 domain-containing protein [Bizionia argentinensis]EGV42450.1 RNA-binding S4 domain-containing protein [Bizionia argentinensis JUB59]